MHTLVRPPLPLPRAHSWSITGQPFPQTKHQTSTANGNTTRMQVPASFQALWTSKLVTRRSTQNQQLFKLAFSCTLVSCRHACRVDVGQRLAWFRRKKSVPGHKAEKARAEELQDSSLAACLGFPLLTSPHYPHWDRSIHHSPRTLLLWLCNAQHLLSHVLPSVWQPCSLKTGQNFQYYDSMQCIFLFCFSNINIKKTEAKGT